MQVRSLLNGDRLPTSEGNTARPLRLGIRPGRVPIYLAALGSGSVRLAAELADGWMPFFLPYSRFGDRVGLLTKVAPSPESCGICPIVGVAAGEDDAAARELLIFGPPAAARDRLARWQGPDGWFPILSLPPNRPVEEIHRALEVLAPTTAA